MDKNTKIILKIESLLQALKQSLGTNDMEVERYAVKKVNRDVMRKFSGLTAEIFSLVKEDYFKKPREISEIRKKLHQRTINKPSTALMRPLRLLIKKRIIDREKPDEGGHYKYFQRKG